MLITFSKDAFTYKTPKVAWPLRKSQLELIGNVKKSENEPVTLDFKIMNGLRDRAQLGKRSWVLSKHTSKLKENNSNNFDYITFFIYKELLY